MPLQLLIPFSFFKDDEMFKWWRNEAHISPLHTDYYEPQTAGGGGDIIKEILQTYVHHANVAFRLFY